MFHRHHFLLLALLLVIFTPLFFFGGDWLSPVSADTALTPLSGYAWSSNIGWISFSSGVDPLAKAYGVKMKANGELIGYAWSSNIGWIKFGPESGSRNIDDAPVAPKKWAYLDLAKPTTAGPQLKGWARACSVYQNDCDGALKLETENKRGGWDGWIAMSGNTTNNNSYGMIRKAERLADGSTVKVFLGHRSSTHLDADYNLRNPIPVARADGRGGAWGGGTFDTNDQYIQTPGWITFAPVFSSTNPPVTPPDGPTPPPGPGPFPPPPPTPNDCSTYNGVHEGIVACPLNVYACVAMDMSGNILDKVNVNQPIYWVVGFTGGFIDDPYNIKWSGAVTTPPSLESTYNRTDANYLKIAKRESYDSIGDKNVSVTVSQDSGATKTIPCSTLSVKPTSGNAVDLVVDPFPKTILKSTDINKSISSKASIMTTIGSCPSGTKITVSLKNIQRKDALGTVQETYTENIDYTPFTPIIFNHPFSAINSFSITLKNVNNKLLWPASGRYWANFEVASSDSGCVVQSNIKSFDLNISRTTGGETIEE